MDKWIKYNEKEKRAVLYSTLDGLSINEKKKVINYLTEKVEAQEIIVNEKAGDLHKNCNYSGLNNSSKIN